MESSPEGGLAAATSVAGRGITEKSGAESAAISSVVSLEDANAIPAQLATVVVKSAKEAVECQGYKALPLSVLRCVVERHGPQRTPFHRVEFRTNYDFTKVSRIQVDGDNTLEVLTDRCVEGGEAADIGVEGAGKPSGVCMERRRHCELRAAPVVLQPAQGQGLRLLFAYVYREIAPLTHWVLVNTRGEEVTFISSAAASDAFGLVTKDDANSLATAGPEGPSAAQPCSMLVFPGGPEAVYARWKAAELCRSGSSPHSLSPSDDHDAGNTVAAAACAMDQVGGGREQDLDVPRPASLAAPTSDSGRSTPSTTVETGKHTSPMQQLKAFWAGMTVQERVSAMSFGRDLRKLAARCYAIVADLHAASRRSVDLGLQLSGLQGCVLVGALEFIPEPGGRQDRPLGMLFGPSLAMRADVWDVFSRALPGWGESSSTGGAQQRARRPAVAPARWMSLFEPPASSWMQLETMLAALLEQRFLHLLGGARSRAAKEAVAAKRECKKQTLRDRAAAKKASRDASKESTKPPSAKVPLIPPAGQGLATEAAPGQVDVTEAVEPHDHEFDCAEEEESEQEEVEEEAAEEEEVEEKMEGAEDEEDEEAQQEPGKPAVDAAACEHMAFGDSAVAVDRAICVDDEPSEEGESMWSRVESKRTKRRAAVAAAGTAALGEPVGVRESTAGTGFAFAAAPHSPTPPTKALCRANSDPEVVQHRGQVAQRLSVSTRGHTPSAVRARAKENARSGGTSSASTCHIPSVWQRNPELLGSSAVEAQWDTCALQDEGGHDQRASGTDSTTHGSASTDTGVFRSELPKISQLAKGWQASVWAAEASSDHRKGTGVGKQYWESRRNENASWRLWYLQQEHGRARGRREVTTSCRERSVSPDACATLAGCLKGCGMGKLCICQPDPWRTPQISGSSGNHPFSSTPSKSECEATDSSERALLEECFAAPPGLEEDADTDMNTPWRSLLRSPPFASPPLVMSSAVDDGSRGPAHALLAAQRRRENAAWRHWWAAHQAESKKLATGFGSASQLPSFPPTPTSTHPGTPRGGNGFPIMTSDSLPFIGTQYASPSQWPVVYLPVPVHIAPQVQRYVEQLAASSLAAMAPGSTADI